MEADYHAHTPLEEGFASTDEAKYVIPALVLATSSLVCIILASCYVLWGSRQIPHCKRFPLLFFGITFVGFAMMMSECIIYILNPELQDCYWIWILYVLGRPMSFLPVTILAWRLRTIYMGQFSFRKMRWIHPAQQAGHKLDDRWMLTRLLLWLLPFAICYPLIVRFGDHADMAHVALQGIGLMFLFVIIMQLFSIKDRLKKHNLDQTWTLLAFWFCITVGDIYANLSWYAFKHFNNVPLSMSLLLMVMSVQAMVVFVLWFTNFRVTMTRVLAQQNTLPLVVALDDVSRDVKKIEALEPKCSKTSIFGSSQLFQYSPFFWAQKASKKNDIDSITTEDKHGSFIDLTSPTPSEKEFKDMGVMSQKGKDNGSSEAVSSAISEEHSVSVTVPPSAFSRLSSRLSHLEDIIRSDV